MDPGQTLYFLQITRWTLLWYLRRNCSTRCDQDIFLLKLENCQDHVKFTTKKAPEYSAYWWYVYVQLCNVNFVTVYDTSWPPRYWIYWHQIMSDPPRKSIDPVIMQAVTEIDDGVPSFRSMVVLCNNSISLSGYLLSLWHLLKNYQRIK